MIFKRYQILWALLIATCLSTGHAAPPADSENAMLEAALEHPLSASETQELELVTRLHTTLAIMYHQSVTEGEQIKTATGQVPDADHWRSLIRRVGDRVVEDFRPIVPQNTHYSLYKNWLKHLSLSRIGNTIYNIARTQGIPAASSIALGAFMDFAGPVFCAAIGHPELAPFTWLVPFEIPGYALGYAIQKQIIKSTLTRLYGGKEAYQKFRQPYFDNLEALHLDGIEDLLIPLTNLVRGNNGAVIADASGTVEKLFTFAGIATRRMNYANLTAFCKKRGLAESVRAALEGNKAIPDQMKTVLLLHYLDEQNDPKVLGDLHDTFSQSFVSMTAKPEFEALTPWIRQFARVRSLEEVHQLMRNVPAGTPAALVAQLWKESILPMVIQNNETIGFGASMKLKTGFYPILAKATSHPDEIWSGTWADEFVSYTKEVYPEDSFPKPPPPKPVAPVVTVTHSCESLWRSLSLHR